MQRIRLVGQVTAIPASCLRTVPEPDPLTLFGLAFERKQLPRIVKNSECLAHRMEQLEWEGLRRRQAAYRWVGSHATRFAGSFPSLLPACRQSRRANHGAQQTCTSPLAGLRNKREPKYR